MKDILKKCPVCGKFKAGVSERANGYAQDVGNDPDATWVACNDCDYENNMDI